MSAMSQAAINKRFAKFIGYPLVGVMLLGLLIGGKQPAAAVIPTGPFKSVDAQYLVNMSKHRTAAHDVEFIASCARAPKTDWAVSCTEMSDAGLSVIVLSQSVSGATARLDQCDIVSGCPFKVRFTFKGGYRHDVVVKEADMTLPSVIVGADHIILE